MRRVGSCAGSGSQRGYDIVLRVSGVDVDFTLDTGADVTVLTEGTSSMLGVKLQDPSKTLVGPDCNRLCVLGQADVRIEGRNRGALARVYVVKGARRNLLGASQIHDLGLLAVVNAIGSGTFDPFSEFPRLFTGLGIMPDVFSITCSS